MHLYEKVIISQASKKHYDKTILGKKILHKISSSSQANPLSSAHQIPASSHDLSTVFLSIFTYILILLIVIHYLKMCPDMLTPDIYRATIVSSHDISGGDI